MGLIRLVIFALVIWMLWRLIKNYHATFQQRQQQRQQQNKKDTDSKLTNANMVACQFCKVHVPEHEAVTHDQQWFCSESHKEKFLADRQ